MTRRDQTGWSGSCLEANYDAALLTRLGNALSHVYDDTIVSTLPPALQALVDQLERATASDTTIGAADQARRR
jgi:hypothetical protein